METFSMQSSALTPIPSSLPRNGLAEKSSGYSQILRFPSSKKLSQTRKVKFADVKASASGATNIRSPEVGATAAKEDSKDGNLAFVAGATGKVGSRTVRELLKLGFRVRAGVRSAKRAENLVQSVKQMKLSTELENSDEVQAVEMLEIVECDLEKRGQIEPALGNASVIICCIGASEKEVFDVTGPYRIDFLATKNLVDAATAAKVNHFIMVSSLGTNKFGFPAAILNLFWGVLCWKRKAEEALIASGLPYTIVRPGGMERPTDAYKETHNITVSPEDTLFGGQVSNLQVAELMACMAKNRSLSYCKVVEVIAETTSPLTPMEELLAKIPSQRAEPQKPITPEKSVPAAAKSIVSEKPSAPIIKAPVQTEAKETKPLSPYTAYDDLKPPTSPTPTLPTSQKVLTIVNGPTTPTTPDSQTSSSGVTVGTTATVSALEEVPRKQPLSPYSAYEDLRPPTSPTPTPPAVKKDITIVDGLSTEISDAQISTSVETTAFTETLVSALEEVPRKPLSPYSAYEDLRPPTSPTPTPPTVKKDITIVDGLSTSDAQICTSVETTASTETLAGPKEVPITGPLCPYIAYDDLKPPSSPSPTPSGPKEVPSPSSTTKEVASQLSEGSNVTKTPDSSVVETNHSPNSIHYHSPYHMYEDLKPPTSPVPSPKRS